MLRDLLGNMQIVIPDLSLPRVSNEILMEISTILFFLFVLSEIIGAYLSNSLSLMGDAAAMSVDVVTYLLGFYAEWAKSNMGRMSSSSRILFEILIPGLSILSLVVVMCYVIYDATKLLEDPPKKDDVNVAYMYAYAAVNLIVDIVSAMLFTARADDVFLEARSVAQLSLDTSVSFDEEEEFGHLDDDLDMITYRDDAFLTQHGAGGYGSSSNGGGEEGLCSEIMHNCCSMFSTFFCMTCNSRISSGTNDGTNSGNNYQSPKKNLNMMSAFVHVMGDTLRTLAMFAAAIVSSTTGLDADVCDAWSAIFAAGTILLMCFPILKEIVVSCKDIRDSRANEDHDVSGISMTSVIRPNNVSNMNSTKAGSSISGGGGQYSSVPDVEA